jgi:hypothetical protein
MMGSAETFRFGKNTMDTLLLLLLAMFGGTASPLDSPPPIHT